MLVHRADGLVISDDPSRLDLERICSWLATSYWAGDRDRPTIERSIAGSRPFGVYGPDGAQLALTRATTDGASFCWLGDVFVDESARGRGIGTWLVGEVVGQLRQEGVPRFLLGTRDAHELYRRIGFESLRVPEVYMELDLRANRPRRQDVRVVGGTPRE
jgi:GNAT superfamily N-acetyltransferase